MNGALRLDLGFKVNAKPNSLPLNRAVAGALRLHRRVQELLLLSPDAELAEADATASRSACKVCCVLGS